VNARALAPLLLLWGCQIGGPDPVPLAGPTPNSVLVAPLPPRATGPDLSEGLSSALRARGYRVVPPDLAAETLRQRGLLQHGEPDANELMAVHRELGADAVLFVTPQELRIDGDRPLDSADWDLDYRLVSTVSGDTLWEQEVRGSYRRPPPAPIDPTVDPFAEPTVKPFTHPAQEYRDAGDLIRSLHRAAFARLPKR
jgi:hypothetical protein